MEFWSWILTAVGLAGFFLAGKKVWWCWYVNIANQVLWFTYAVLTEQWGFLIGVFAYLFVFTKNAIEWTREHRAKESDLKVRFTEHPLSAAAPIEQLNERVRELQVRGGVIHTLKKLTPEQAEALRQRWIETYGRPKAICYGDWDMSKKYVHPDCHIREIPHPQHYV